MTWYTPAYEPWSMYRFRIFQVIGKHDDGEKKMGLQVALKDPPNGRPVSLRATLDGQPPSAPASPPACRSDQQDSPGAQQDDDWKSLDPSPGSRTTKRPA